MKNIVKMALFAAAIAVGTSACKEEPPPPPPPPPKVEPPPPPPPPPAPTIPEYAPTGDHADMKKEAAKDITAENAVEKAKALEADLDKQIADMAAKAPAKK